MVDPSGGWAKAVKASAEFGGKVVDAARDLGSFIAGPAAEVVGMVEDQIKVARYGRRLRLMARVDALMKERGMSGPTRQLPLAVARVDRSDGAHRPSKGVRWPLSGALGLARCRPAR